MRIPAFMMISLLALPVVAYAQDKPATSSTSATALLSGEQATGQGKNSIIPVSEDYICPMHRNVHGKKGGVCPICGMTLILAHADNQSMTPAPEMTEPGKDDSHE
jgi:hypothetical protein